MPRPADSPDLNPAEQSCRSLRATLATRIFADLAELEAARTAHLAAFGDRPATLRQRTASPCWLRSLPTTP